MEVDKKEHLNLKREWAIYPNPGHWDPTTLYSLLKNFRDRVINSATLPQVTKFTAWVTAELSKSDYVYLRVKYICRLWTLFLLSQLFNR